RMKPFRNPSRRKGITMAAVLILSCIHKDTNVNSFQYLYAEGEMRPPRPFPAGTLERLQRGLKEARNKAEFQRVQCLWLRAALGLNANQVGQALGWRPTSVRRLQAQYWRQGEALR